MDIEYKKRTAKIIRQSAAFACVNYEAFHDKRLTKTEMDVLIALSIMAGKKQSCFPSVAFICQVLDLNFETQRRNVRRYLSKLERLGYINRQTRFRETGHQTSNMIHLKYPSFTPPLKRDYNNSYLKKEKIKEKKGNGSLAYDYRYEEQEYLHSGEEESHLEIKSSHFGFPLLSPRDSKGNAQLSFKMVRKWNRSLRTYAHPGEPSFLDIRSKPRAMNTNKPTYKQRLTWRERMSTELNEEQKQTLTAVVDNLRKQKYVTIYPSSQSQPLEDPIDLDLGVVTARGPAEMAAINACLPKKLLPNGQEYGSVPEKCTQYSPNLPPIYVDKSVNNEAKPATVAENVDLPKKAAPTWKEIQDVLQKKSITFSSWSHGLTYGGIRGDVLHLGAKNAFFRDQILQRYVLDIIWACNFLGYCIKKVEVNVQIS